MYANSSIDNEMISKSPEQTIALGREFGQTLEAGDIICLRGGLGAGKTHFVKGVAMALDIDTADVHSPTFSLINEYMGKTALYHFDCYRMESPEEALQIGAEEYFYGKGVCIIEWPERIGQILPPDAIWISIEVPNRQTRKFVISKSNL